jgi:hypothetical protein
MLPLSQTKQARYPAPCLLQLLNLLYFFGLDSGGTIPLAR